MELPVQLIAIISEEDVDTVQEMVRPQVKDIKDRKLVLVLLDQVSKVADAIIQKIAKERFQMQKL